MNSKGHLIISLAKSVIRVVGGVITLSTNSIVPLAMGVGGVYWAECVADLTAACLCGTIFFFRFRKILKGMDKVESTAA